MLNRLASLAMSTNVLKALPGKLDIKRHSPSILYLCAQCTIYDDYGRSAFFAAMLMFAIFSEREETFLRDKACPEALPSPGDDESLQGDAAESFRGSGERERKDETESEKNISSKCYENSKYENFCA